MASKIKQMIIEVLETMHPDYTGQNLTAIYKNPTKKEIEGLKRDVVKEARERQRTQGTKGIYGSVRGITHVDGNNNVNRYVWNGTNLLHDDVANLLKIPRNQGVIHYHSYLLRTDHTFSKESGDFPERTHPAADIPFVEGLASD